MGDIRKWGGGRAGTGLCLQVTTPQGQTTLSYTSKPLLGTFGKAFSSLGLSFPTCDKDRINLRALEWLK